MFLVLILSFFVYLGSDKIANFREVRRGESGLNEVTNDYRSYTTMELTVKNKKYIAYIADTDEKRDLGLSNSLKPNPNEGMLFVFDTVDVKPFWMKNMNYDLEMIWLDENYNFLGSTTALASSYNYENPELSEIFSSPANTKFVLEIAK